MLAIRIEIILGLILVLFVRSVDTFAIVPLFFRNSNYGVRISSVTKKDPFTTASRLYSTVNVDKKKEEKLTKEASELLDALEAKQKGEKALILAQVAPSVRVAISEEFGQEPGAFEPGQLVAALKKLGFDLVLDTNTGADITICEEGTELLQRLRARKDCEKQHNKKTNKFGKIIIDDNVKEPLPLFTSCCPGWLLFIQKSAPELEPYISSCKSPHMMYGALVKNYCEDLLGKSAKDVYFTSVMPCVRKRAESDQECFINKGGVREIDNVVTTKDIGQLFRMKQIDPAELQPVPFDSPFQIDGAGSGAGQLFGAAGGVMEAAVRTLYELVTGKPLPELELNEVRGLDGVKEATISLADATDEDLPDSLRVAVCNGLGNAKQLIQKMKDGDAEYDFVEVMACPGGCIGGGGQPKGEKDAIQKRLECIYNLDRSRTIRRSHENPTAQEFYKDKYLGGFGSEKAHELLHVEPVYKKKRDDNE